MSRKTSASDADEVADNVDMEYGTLSRYIDKEGVVLPQRALHTLAIRMLTITIFQHQHRLAREREPPRLF